MKLSIATGSATAIRWAVATLLTLALTTNAIRLHAEEHPSAFSAGTQSQHGPAPLGPEAVREIRDDAATAHSELAAELRAQLVLLTRANLAANAAAMRRARETPAAEEQRVELARSRPTPSSTGGVVQPRAAIEHTRVFMTVREQQAQRGALVQ